MYDELVIFNKNEDGTFKLLVDLSKVLSDGRKIQIDIPKVLQVTDEDNGKEVLYYVTEIDE